MQIIRQAKSKLNFWQIDGNGSDVLEGALLMPGVTPGTNESVLIQASGAGADAAGINASLHDFSVDGDADEEAGTNFKKKPVHVFLPGDEVAAEFSHLAADDLAVSSWSGAAVTISSLEDDMDGGWIYVISATTGAGLLSYIVAADTSGVTVKTAPDTDPSGTVLASLMRPRFHQTTALSADATKLRTLNTVGSLPWRTLDLQILEPGASRWESLDPTKHDNTVYGSASGINAPRFRAILSPADTLYNPLD